MFVVLVYRPELHNIHNPLEATEVIGVVDTMEDAEALVDNFEVPFHQQKAAKHWQWSTHPAPLLPRRSLAERNTPRAIASSYLFDKVYFVSHYPGKVDLVINHEIRYAQGPITLTVAAAEDLLANLKANAKYAREQTSR